jgi:hypothetical protein
MFKPRGLLYISIEEWALALSMLKIKGAPTSLRLAHDLELFLKEIKQTIKRLDAF